MAGAALGVAGIALQQACVGIALDVGAEDHPALLNEQIGDQALGFGGILDLVLGLAKTNPSRPCCLPRSQLPPAFAMIKRPGQLGLLMGELEEQQHAELFQVVAIGEPIVAEHGAVGPERLRLRCSSVGVRGGVQG